MFDFALLLVAGLCQLALGLLGLRVSFRPPKRRRGGRYELAFFVIGVIGLGALVWSGWRSVSVQNVIAAGVERLQVRLGIVSNEAAGQIQDRLAMKDLIGQVIDEADKIGADWATKDEVEFKHQTNLWTNKSGNLIEDAYGKGEASLFMNDAGYISYSDGSQRAKLHNWIIHRVQRLNELFQRVDMLAMRPEFDPKKYHWVGKCDSC